MQSLNKILLGRQYVAMELFAAEAEKAAILLVKQSNGELLIEKQECFPVLDEIPLAANKSLPHYLIINNSQTIQKEVLATDASDDKILHKAFPNFNAADFYYEIWRLKTKSVIVVIRKQYVESLIKQYKECGYLLTGIGLGVTSLAEIAKFSPDTYLYTNNNALLFSDEVFLSRETTVPRNNAVNGIEVESTYLLAFSGVLRMVTRQTATSGNLHGLNRELYDQYYQEQLFSKGLRTIVGFLLVLLLLNFFAFTHYFKKAEALQVDLSETKSQEIVVQKLKENIREKETKINKVLVGTASRSSLMVNEITKDLPHSILLSEMTYNPLAKKIKPGEPIQIEENSIVVSGKTIDNSGFTQWIERMEKLRWVNNIVITQFGNNENASSSFTIKIILQKDGLK